MASLTLGVYAHWRKPGAAESVRELGHALAKEGINVLLEANTAELVGEKGQTLEWLRSQVDLFVALGGDGTLLRLVRDLHGGWKPIVGVNFGSLGFLTAFGGPGFSEVASSLAEGNYRVEERTLLQTTIERDRKPVITALGLNDIVVSRGERSRLVQIAVTIDDSFLTEYNADGLIIATATGSTAYSLSAGGPIVAPNSSVFVITPICPHVLTNRSVIVAESSVIHLKPSRGDQPVFLSVDGQESTQFHPGDCVAVRKASVPLPLVFPKHLGFADVLRSKLRWSGSAI
ncbi:MAG TPA: NAD(+)/NADH kinase [Chthoniobacterales bacterium]|nr:NAD(+)/NADH kinase [Chthoniobacterales bacterium]